MGIIMPFYTYVRLYFALIYLLSWLLSVAVIITMTKSSLGQDGLVSACTFITKEGRVETHAGTEAKTMEKLWLN